MKSSDSYIRNGYLGTYESSKSHGIYRFSLNMNTGQLSVPELYSKIPDCKYLSLYQGLLAAPVQHSKKAGICLLDTAPLEPQLLDELDEEEAASCFVTQDEDFVYTANYHEGIVLIYRKSGRKLSLEKKIVIAPKAGCHQVLFHDGYLLVPCLLLDEIRIFDPADDFRQCGKIAFPYGTGPRHGVFTRDHRYLFVVSELSNELYMFAVKKTDAGSPPEFEQLCVHPLLKQKGDTTDAPISAAIRLSPDERFLYLSTRYADVISVFAVVTDRVVMIQQTDCGGAHPRDITLTADGSYLLVANRTEGGLVCFPVDPENGRLGPVTSRVPAWEAVSIVLDEGSFSES